MQVINAKVFLTDESHTTTFSQSYTTTQEIPPLNTHTEYTYIHRGGADVSTDVQNGKDFIWREILFSDKDTAYAQAGRGIFWILES